MGSDGKRQKPPKVVDAEVTSDGCIMVELNVSVPMGNSKKIIIPPETIIALAEEYASMPPAQDTDYPGVPVLEYDDVFPDDEKAPVDEE